MSHIEVRLSVNGERFISSLFTFSCLIALAGLLVVLSGSNDRGEDILASFPTLGNTCVLPLKDM